MSGRRDDSPEKSPKYQPLCVLGRKLESQHHRTRDQWMASCFAVDGPGNHQQKARYKLMVIIAATYRIRRGWSLDTVPVSSAKWPQNECGNQVTVASALLSRVTIAITLCSTA